MSATVAGDVALPAKAPPNKWIVAISITFGTLMGTIDSSIVNVALPHIRGAVGATVEEITAISTSYIIANVVVMPLTGFLGRLFGQKRVYMFCLALFVVGSALCGTAHSLGQLILYRTLQGLGAGALQPTEQAILRQTFPKEEQGTAMALFALAVMIGPAVGPTLGGWITDNYSWQWIFYINLPVGALGLFMVSTFVQEPPDLLEKNRATAAQTRANIDWAGIAFLWLALGSLQYILEQGSKDDWFASGTIQACAFVTVVSVLALIVREWTAPAPVINLSLFRDPSYVSGTLIGGVMFGMLIGSMFLLPVFMQELLGFTAVQSGLALMPRTLVMMVVTPVVGRIYNRVHPGLIIACGVCFFSLGSWQLSHLTLESGSSDIVWALATTGIGFSCLFVPLSTVALANIPRDAMSDATGLNSLVRQVGGSIGLTVFAELQVRYQTTAHQALLSHVTATSPAAQQRVAGMAMALAAHGMDAVAAHTAALEALSFTLLRQAAVLSFEQTFLLQGISFLFVLPLLWFLKVDRSVPAPKADLHME